MLNEEFFLHRKVISLYKILATAPSEDMFLITELCEKDEWKDQYTFMLKIVRYVVPEFTTHLLEWKYLPFKLKQLYNNGYLQAKYVHKWFIRNKLKKKDVDILSSQHEKALNITIQKLLDWQTQTILARGWAELTNVELY